MTRDDASDIKRALTDVRLVVRELGLDKGAKRQARGLIVCCPVHGDRSPSCSVTLAPDNTIRAKCFACDFAGDIFALIAAARGLDVRGDFRAVLEDAADMAGVSLEGSRQDRPVRPPQRPVAAFPDEPAPLTPAEFDRLAKDLLGLCLLDASDAGPVRTYLEGRRLLVPAEGALWGALPPVSRQLGLVAALCDLHGRDIVGRSGFVRRDDAGEPDFHRFAWPGHRLMIPWFTPDSLVQTVQRRRLDAGEPRYVALPGRRMDHPYGIEELEGAPVTAPLVYVEGAIDALAAKTLYAMSKGPTGNDVERIALGIPGIANWRKEWATHAKGRHVFVGVDPDPAGDRHVDKMIADLLRAGAVRITRTEVAGRRKDWGAELEGGRHV